MLPENIKDLIISGEIEDITLGKLHFGILHKAFCCAAENGKLDVVNHLVEIVPSQKIREEMIHSWYETAFQEAAKNGHLEVVNRLIELTPDKIAQQEMIHSDSDNAFKFACKNGHLTIMDRLITLSSEQEQEEMLHSGEEQACCFAVDNKQNAVINYILKLTPDQERRNQMADFLVRYFEVEDFEREEVQKVIDIIKSGELLPIKDDNKDQPANPSTIQREAKGLSIDEIIQKETIDCIKNPSEYYSHYGLNFIIDAAIVKNEQARLIPLEDSYNFAVNLPINLWNFQQSEQIQAVIPIRPNNDQDEVAKEHFTGLFIRRNEEGYFDVTYIDPIGSGEVSDIPVNIKDALHEILGVSSDEITSTVNKIQHRTLDNGVEGGVEYLTNNHCGPFTGFILSGLVLGNIRIDNDKLQTITAEGWQDIPDLGEEHSNSFGINIRERDLGSVLGEAVSFPEIAIENIGEPDTGSEEGLNEITRGVAALARKVAEADDVNFQTPKKHEIKSSAFVTPDIYRQSIDRFNEKNKFTETQGARGNSIVYNRGILKNDKETYLTDGVNSKKRAKKSDIKMRGEGRTTAFYYPVIEQSNKEFTFDKSFRKSGHDELFQWSRNEVIYPKERNKIVGKLKEAIRSSLHVKGGKEEGEMQIWEQLIWCVLDDLLELGGGDDKDSLTFVKAVELARVPTKELHSFESGHASSIFSDNTVTDARSSVKDGYFKESGTVGDKQGWDPDKIRIIRNLILQIWKNGELEEERKYSPIKATAELLKLATRKVARYDDDINESNSRFQASGPFYTSSGLDLSNDAQREYALKTTQAARDKFKMSVVALENRWNGENSDDEDLCYKDRKSTIKNKVARTIISGEIHGEDGDRSFSPIRSGTPYSDFNFDLNFEHLEEAAKKTGQEFYEAVTNVFSQPTPAIRPLKDIESFINSESPDEKFRRKEVVREKSRESAKKAKIISEGRNLGVAEEDDLRKIMNPVTPGSKGNNLKNTKSSATAKILFKNTNKSEKKERILEDLNNWDRSDAGYHPDYESLSQLINHSDINLSIEERQKVSKSVVKTMRSLKNTEDTGLKGRVDQFFKCLSDNNLLDHNLLDNDWPPLYRSANYGYRSLFNSLYVKCEPSAFNFEYKGDSSLKTVVRNCWFEESKAIIKKVTLDPELGHSIIKKSGFTKEQKDELLESMSQNTSGPLGSMSVLDEALPSSTLKPNSNVSAKILNSGSQSRK